MEKDSYIRDLSENLADWSPRVRPGREVFQGRYARLAPLSANEHAEPIHHLNSVDESIWKYLAIGPYSDSTAYRVWVESVEKSADPVFWAIFDREQDHWAGVASFLRFAPEMGSIEVGNICFSPALQKTRAATEAIFLMMDWVFSAGYRRFEWKCNALNLPSRRAAERLGFSFEGVFRQHIIIKGRSRDTAWFAMIDKDWPAIQAAFGQWLSVDNFDKSGVQRVSLSSLTAPLLEHRDPVFQTTARP